MLPDAQLDEGAFMFILLGGLIAGFILSAMMGRVTGGMLAGFGQWRSGSAVFWLEFRRTTDGIHRFFHCRNSSYRRRWRLVEWRRWIRRRRFRWGWRIMGWRRWRWFWRRRRIRLMVTIKRWFIHTFMPPVALATGISCGSAQGY